jgi:hypothetical protein
MSKFTNVSDEITADNFGFEMSEDSSYFFLFACLSNSSTLKMEAVHSF